MRALALALLLLLVAPALHADDAARAAHCAQTLDYLAARETIAFEPSSSRLTGVHGALIDDLANLVARCPDMVLHIEGHTDDRGDPDFNLALSTARAQAVADALTARGITASRLRVAGFGGARPVADNETRDGRRANRRITLRFERVPD